MFELSPLTPPSPRGGEGKLNRFFLLLAAGFGVGFFPIVPGTMGTLLAVPLYCFLSDIPSPLYELTLAAFFFFSSWVSGKAQDYWGNKDDRRIVIDEIVGFLMTMLWIPKSVLSIIIGFFLFRIFDILKPPPIRRLEAVKGGFGVVLDDVLAGVYANILLRLILISLAQRGL